MARPVQYAEDLQPLRGRLLLHPQHRPRTSLKLGGHLQCCRPKGYNTGQRRRCRRHERDRRRPGAVHARSHQRHQPTAFVPDLVGRPASANRIRPVAHLSALRRREQHPRRHRRRSTPSPYWDRAFLQFAGVHCWPGAGIFLRPLPYWGTYTYTNVRINGDTDITGQNLWAYTAELGNGFSATLSLEDPAVRKAFTFDAMVPGFFGLNGAVVTDNAVYR